VYVHVYGSHVHEHSAHLYCRLAQWTTHHRPAAGTAPRSAASKQLHTLYTLGTCRVHRPTLQSYLFYLFILFQRTHMSVKDAPSPCCECRAASSALAASNAAARSASLAKCSLQAARRVSKHAGGHAGASMRQVLFNFMHILSSGYAVSHVYIYVRTRASPHAPPHQQSGACRQRERQPGGQAGGLRILS
jgi:hypothetical protein